MTRFSMGTPFNFRDANYKDYQCRLRECNLMNMLQRRKLAYIIFIIRIIKNEVFTKCNGIISRQMRINRPNTRNSNIIIMDHNLIQHNSALYTGIKYLNQYRQIININESLLTIKKKLKIHMLKEL